METIGAAEFKAQCLALLDRLDAEGLIVTKHGKPVAKVIPYGPRDADLIGSMRGLIKVDGYILSTGIDWSPGDRP